MRNTLICTVGTSLLNNLKFSQEVKIKLALEQNNLNQLALLLLEKNNLERLCGAEINSITSICHRKLIALRSRLIFLVSDTNEGKKIGFLLKLYYENSRNPLKFTVVEVRILEGLRDDDIKAFKQLGLKNLVKQISIEVRKFSPETIAINATGGYKAQISFAATIGQALEIPVYYLFEKFSEVIELPPQPVALDLVFWLENYLFFTLLENEDTIAFSELKQEINNESFLSLIDRVEIDGQVYLSFSAMGVLFNERCRLQFAKQETTLLTLVPIDNSDPTRKMINLRDDHGIDILKEFAKKVCRSPYVKKIINSLPFNPKLTNPIKATKPDGIVEFILTWTDPGYGLCIQTTARNLVETNTIAIHLAEKYTQ